MHSHERLLVNNVIIHMLQVGYNKGDGIHCYSHPSSLSPDIRYIYGQSNVGVRGRWVHRVDGTGAL